MKQICRSDALAFLRSLHDQPLYYGVKSSDTDLYEFGFGIPDKTKEWYGAIAELCPYILHIMCRFKVIWRNEKEHIDIFFEDTPQKEFLAKINALFGQKVKQVALSDKNDLWLDFGFCWVVFITFETEDESWRFFSTNINVPHLVASSNQLEFIN